MNMLGYFLLYFDKIISEYADLFFRKYPNIFINKHLNS
jgi:hypothetical protein